LHDKLELIGSITGPVQAPSSTTNKIDAAMDLLRLLEEAGFIAGAFDADDLFRLELDAIRITAAALFNLLKPLVGELPAAKAPESKVTYAQSPEYHTGSSQYASATSEAGSNSSLGSRRMSLGPSGAAMLKARSTDESEERTPVPRVATSRPDRKASTTPPQDPASGLETYFQAAMARFLSERPEGGAPRPAASPPLGEQDVDMESAGSQDHPEH